MIIKWSPQVRTDNLMVIKTGEVLTINGEDYNFAPLVDGATLPAAATGCPWIWGEVERINGELTVPLILPHGADASEAARFPVPQTVSADGPITVPC